MPIFRSPYRCEGRADTHYIPEFQLAEGLDVTPKRVEEYSKMVTDKKQGQKFFQKHRRSIQQIKIVQDDDDIGDFTSLEVCEHRDAYCRVRERARPSDELRWNETVPKIKIDTVNPKMQFMLPSEWTFEAALQREIPEDEINQRLGCDILSPCQTHVRTAAQSSAAPTAPKLRSIKTDPVKPRNKDKDDKRRLSSFFRRKSR